MKAYSGQEMKKAYYEAFWRARCVRVSLLILWVGEVGLGGGGEGKQRR